MSGASDVAVVICTHNSSDDLRRVLPSVLAEEPAEVVVVDNASQDDCVGIARELGAKGIDSGGNVGYARAMNIGAAATSAPIIMVVNPDCIVQPGAFDRLAEQLRTDPLLGVVGPRIEYPDGRIQHSARAFPDVGTAAVHGFLGLFWKDNPVSARYTLAGWDHASRRVVDWVSGAAMAIRREALDQIGGFDERYWMYVEDVDLCWRMWKCGWVVLFEPTAVVRHTVGTSSGRHPYRLMWGHHRSMLNFELVRREGRRGLTWPVIVAGATVRFLMAAAKRAVTSHPVESPDEWGSRGVAAGDNGKRRFVKSCGPPGKNR